MMSTKTPRTYAPRIPRVEAERRLIDAAIDLLKLGNFKAVSPRKVAQRAGVHAPTIARYFGSMTGLFAAVAGELAHRSLTTLPDRSEELLGYEELLLRSRLVAWCIFNGASPEEFMTTRFSEGGQALLERQKLFSDVSMRTTAAMTEISRFAFVGFAVLGQTHEFNDQQVADTFALIQEIRRHLPDVKKTLGWNEEPQA